jgi:hypothetical protein
MESKLAEEARAALLSAVQPLSPEERLNAFLDHCELVMARGEAGRQLKARAAKTEP